MLIESTARRRRRRASRMARLVAIAVQREISGRPSSFSRALASQPGGPLGAEYDGDTAKIAEIVRPTVPVACDPKAVAAFLKWCILVAYVLARSAGHAVYHIPRARVFANYLKPPRAQPPSRSARSYASPGRPGSSWNLCKWHRNLCPLRSQDLCEQRWLVHPTPRHPKLAVPTCTIHGFVANGVIFVICAEQKMEQLPEHR